MIITFDTRGNDKQKQAAAAWINPRILEIVYGGSKGSGKTHLGLNLIFGDAMLYPGTLYFVARKELNDLRKFTIPSVAEVFKNWGLDSTYYKYNGQDNYFTLPNGSKVYFLEAKYIPSDPLFERFGSLQFTRGMIEEAGEITRDAKNNLQASIGRWMNDTYNLPPKLIMTCNPTKNFLYSDFYKKHKDGKLEEYRTFIQALPQDNKMLPDGYLLNLERTLSPTQRRRLLLGDWEFDDDPSALIEYEAILDLFTNDFVEPTTDNYISSDLATRGRDLWVTSSWRGLVGKIEKAVDFSEPKYMEEYLRDLAIRRRVARSKIVADSDGLGQWLGSYMPGIVEFRNGSRAHNSEKYVNLKAECAFKLAELINSRSIRLECAPEHREHIIAELEVLREVNMEVDTAKHNIISKDEMKLILGRSPDFLDNLIMRCYFLINPPSQGVRRLKWRAKQ